jgi:hypothetical protein
VFEGLENNTTTKNINKPRAFVPIYIRILRGEAILPFFNSNKSMD